MKNTSLENTVTISERFCGPPDCGNGGYTSGCLAQFVGEDSVAVKLKAPTPLDIPLSVREENNQWRLMAGEQVVVEAWPQPLEMEVPEAADLEQIKKAHHQCSGFLDHPFPGCFVCGPEREVDGLGLYPGPVTNGQGVEMVASYWEPKAEFFDQDNNLLTPIIWAALDCPTSFAALEYTENQALVPMVLGTFVVKCLKPIPRQQGFIVQAWSKPGLGRKVPGYSAITSLDGECYAYAEALWISIKK